MDRNTAYNKENQLELKQRKTVLVTSMYSQTEAMKRLCVEWCANLDSETVTAEEKRCYASCVTKAKNFVEHVDQLYLSKFF